MTTARTFDVNDLAIDSTLIGGAMRDELVIMYNKLVYWTEQHSEWDAQKKQVENLLEEAKDKAKAARAKEADEKGLKAKIQEAFIRDFWDVELDLFDTDGGCLTTSCEKLNRLFIEASKQESITRHKMNLCNTALDIGRTAVSWDRAEFQKTGGHSVGN